MLGIADVLHDKGHKASLPPDLFDAEYSSEDDDKSINDSTDVGVDAAIDAILGGDGGEDDKMEGHGSSSDNGGDILARPTPQKQAKPENKMGHKASLPPDLFDAEYSSEDDDKSINDSTDVGVDAARDAVFDEDGSEDDKMEGHESSSENDEDHLARPTPLERAKPDNKKVCVKPRKPRRVKQAAIELIHSESQRIIRDSRISLPCYNVKRLSLDEFFSKKPNFNQIKAPQAHSRSLQRRCIMEDRPEKKSKSHRNGRKIKSNINNEEKEDMKVEEKESWNLIKKKEMKESSTDAGLTDEDLENLVLRLDSDDLSDDPLELEDPFSKTDKSMSEQINDKHRADQENDNLLMETDKEIYDGETVSLKTDSQDWSLRLDTQTLSEDYSDPIETTRTQELDYSTKSEELLNPGNSVERCNDTKNYANEIDSPKEIPVHKLEDLTLKQNSVKKSCSSEASERRRQRLLEKLKGYKMVMPKLSGGLEDFIDFDKDGSLPKTNTGVTTLMERFVKHSTKISTKKKKTEIQLEVVKKELNSEGKEELVHELIPVTLEAEEEQQLLTPGAKLLKLKETLQIKMKAQREIERQRRLEAYKLDNEEGFLEDDQEDEQGLEEKELSDQSDTDEDCEEERDNDDEIKEKMKSNMFLDNEAQDDNEEEFANEENNEKSNNEHADAEDSDDELVLRSNTKKKRKKRIMDDDEEEEGVVNFHDNVNRNLGNSLLDKSSFARDDTSTRSSTSFKSLFKNPVRYTAPMDGKTMDLFDSSTNTTNPSDENGISSNRDEFSGPVVGSFSWTPIREKKGLIKHKSMDFATTPDSDQDDEPESMEKDRLVTSQVESTGAFVAPIEPNDSLNSSCDIPPYQRQTSSLDKSSSKDSSIGFFPGRRQMAQNISKFSELTLPVEDSQDLFQQDSYPPSPTSVPIIETSNQNFHLSFEDDTQTQFLDENGFLKVKSKDPCSKKLLLLINENSQSENDMDELLGLCSGQFMTAPQPAKSGQGIFSQLGKTNTQDMDELLQLCSGPFTGNTKSQKMTHCPASDNESEASFQMMSDNESMKSKRKDDFSSDEEEDQQKEDEDVDEEMDEKDQTTYMSRNEEELPKPHKNNFIDEEAELSGSEFGSDEEYDAEEFGDLLPEDEDIGNQDEINDKIQRVHMKLADDEDARQLRLYKEAFLTDGDLHDGNKGRTKQFKWRNMEDSSMSAFNNNSDNEVDEEEEDNIDECEWRKQRHDREQCLKEEDEKSQIQDEEEDCIILDENSQFDQIIKKVAAKKSKKAVVIKATETTAKITSSRLLTTKFNRGSFLNRGKHDLQRITNMVKPLGNPNGPRNARNFVFQAASPERAPEPEQKPKVKRALSVSGKVASRMPLSKKPRLDRSSSQPQSIFNHF